MQATFLKVVPKVLSWGDGARPRAEQSDNSCIQTLSNEIAEKMMQGCAHGSTPTNRFGEFFCRFLDKVTC